VQTERAAYLQHQLRGVALERRRQHQEYALTLGIGIIRMMAGSDWRPLEVQFEHEPPPRTNEHARVFGAPVLFRCMGNAMVIEREFCDRQVPTADRRQYPILEDYLERQLENRPTENRFVISVQAAIGNAMKDGEPKVADVAAAIGVSVRTLQRRLSESDVDYRALVDDTRRDLALRYLRDRRHTPSDVAYLLGYSELSAFSRAFRRWTGSTPSDYRRRNG
jgi:AraC-like DNA-binding protein